MIGWIFDRLVELVVDPQGDPLIAGTIDLSDLDLPDDHSLVAARDPDAAPLNANAQELDVISTTSAPIDGSYEIGGGVEVRHTITLALSVEHGDARASRRIRDAITLALVLRLRASELELRSTRDPASGQYVSRVTWSVDYRPLEIDTPNEYATVTFTIDATLDG